MKDHPWKFEFKISFGDISHIAWGPRFRRRSHTAETSLAQGKGVGVVSWYNIQSGTVITRSNITWSCTHTHHCRNGARISIRVWTLTGELWGAFVIILEKFDRVKSALAIALGHLQSHTWVYIYIYTYIYICKLYFWYSSVLNTNKS